MLIAYYHGELDNYCRYVFYFLRNIYNKKNSLECFQTLFPELFLNIEQHFSEKD